MKDETGRRGRFIVLEGLDGSGTTTQARLLQDHLVGRGHAVALTHEPTDEPIGKLIRDALSGRLQSTLTQRPLRLSEESLALLFAADRTEHSRHIEGERERGRHVVSDRYVLSSIAYQSTSPSMSPARVIELNRGVAIPDVTIMLRVPVEQCVSRLSARKDSPTIYENRELLGRIDASYTAVRDIYTREFGPLIDVDGTGRIEDVLASIVEITNSYIR